MATVRNLSTSAKLASQAIPSATETVATATGTKAVKAPWICNMPTRAIAAALLDTKGHILKHEALYHAADESGLFKSHRHFKQCLRLLKEQKRVVSINLGPEHVGSAKLDFAIKLTARGGTIYRRYMKTEGIERRNEDGNEGSRGLKDALG